MFKDQINCLNEKTENNEIEINENKLFEKIYNMLDNENNDENVIYILYQKMFNDNQYKIIIAEGEKIKIKNFVLIFLNQYTIIIMIAIYLCSKAYLMMKKY